MVQINFLHLNIYFLKYTVFPLFTSRQILPFFNSATHFLWYN